MVLEAKATKRSLTTAATKQQIAESPNCCELDMLFLATATSGGYTTSQNLLQDVKDLKAS